MYCIVVYYYRCLRAKIEYLLDIHIYVYAYDRMAACVYTAAGDC